MTSAELAPIVRRALEEDLDKAGDVTSEAVIPEATRARAKIVACERPPQTAHAAGAE